MPAAAGDFEVSSEELRTVARYVTRHAENVQPVFQREHPDDDRPRAALDAAWLFIHGDPRPRLQQVASLDAHRAAAAASTEPARLAARAAGDAASATYLHPIARAHQVGHILRAAACAARIAELQHHDEEAAAEVLQAAQHQAGATLIDVLRRYPPLPPGRTRVDQLMGALDASLRASG